MLRLVFDGQGRKKDNNGVHFALPWAFQRNNLPVKIGMSMFPTMRLVYKRFMCTMFALVLAWSFTAPSFVFAPFMSDAQATSVSSTMDCPHCDGMAKSTGHVTCVQMSCFKLADPVIVVFATGTDKAFFILQNSKTPDGLVIGPATPPI